MPRSERRRSGRLRGEHPAPVPGLARYAAPPPPPSFTCPACGRTSFHPGDVSSGYCGACRGFTGQGAWPPGDLGLRWVCEVCGESFLVPPGHPAPVFCGNHAPPQAMTAGPAGPPYVPDPLVVTGAIQGLAFSAEGLAELEAAGFGLRTGPLQVTAELDGEAMGIIRAVLGLGPGPGQAAVRELRGALSGAAQSVEEFGDLLGQAAVAWGAACHDVLGDVQAAMASIAGARGWGVLQDVPDEPDDGPWGDAMSWSPGMPCL